MIKLIGVILLLAGFCGLSFEKVREEKANIKRLQELKRFTTYLLNEIEYSHIPIPDICQEYIEKSEGVLKTFLEKVCEQFQLNSGKSFDCIWRAELKNNIDSYSVKKEERVLLKNLCKSFGFCNIRMQVSAIEQYLQEIDKILLQKEKKFQDNKKLILYFGVMSGLLLSIILL